MAAVWIAALKSVPWSEVIALTPTLVDGARKLRDAVRRRMPGGDLPSQDTPLPEKLTVATLGEQLSALGAETEQLRQQMLVSSELIQKLADQNAQLIAHLEQARARLRWLSLTAIGALLLAGLGLALHAVSPT